jgi:trans-aconitate 2-methyltransferase
MSSMPSHGERRERRGSMSAAGGVSGADPRVRWDAEAYARNSTAQQQWALELIAMLDLNGGESVLDIGSGDGKVTAEIARRVPRGRVVGLDSSEDMVRLARAAFPSASWPNLRFQEGDARTLELHEELHEQFDVVFSNATLHWVKDHRPVLSGAARCLRRGGRVLLQMGGRGNGAQVFEAAEAMAASKEWERWFRGFEFPWGFHAPEEYSAWCRDAGLTPRRVELLPRTMRQNGAEGLAGWIRTTWMPYTGRVPEDRREAFIREAVARYLAAHPAKADGTVEVAMVRLEVDAVRD